MRKRMAWLCAFALPGTAVLAALSLTRGQDPPPRPQPPPALAPAPEKVPPTAAPASPPEVPKRDLSKLSPLQQEIYWGAVRGANWLYQMNDPKGRFVPGHLPALGKVMEGDHFLRQAGAAFALARAARFAGDERLAVRAAQALLVLREETVTDPNDPQVRHTALSSGVVNRLAAAGLLVLAVNELPSPKEDLLKMSEQLCNFIRRQQQADGALCCADAPGAADSDGVTHFPGVALYGLALSQRRQPEAWKLDVLRKAAAYYRPRWQQHRDPAFAAWQTAANAEAYLLTQEKAFAEFVFEMGDWLCALQYDRLDPRHPLWQGGFKGWADGKPVEAEPTAFSACCAAGLAEACRVARAAADARRHDRYGEALLRGLQFVTRLQFTVGNTQHFADRYKEWLLGAFFASHQDGNVRLDYTQHAVSALVQYLTYVAR